MTSTIGKWEETQCEDLALTSAFLMTTVDGHGTVCARLWRTVI